MSRAASPWASRAAPSWAVGTVSRWRQQTIYSTVNVAAQRKVMLEGIKEFQAKIQPDKLYAAYASYREELGGRPYWLLLTKSN